MAKTLELTLADARKPQVAPQGGYLATKCAHAATLDHDGTDPDLKVEDSAMVVKLKSDGNDFEAEIAEDLRAFVDPSMIVFLTGDRTLASKKAREAATAEAMDQGVLAIWNARLAADLSRSIISEPDMLVRIGSAPMANGKWAYAGVDVKHAKTHDGGRGAANDDGDETVGTWLVSDFADPRFEAATRTAVAGKPKLKHSLQLAHYHRHLQALGHAPETDEEIWAGIIGKERRIIWRDLASHTHLHWDRDSETRHQMTALEIYDQEFSHRLEVIETALSIKAGADIDALTFPEWKSECGECPWRKVCKGDLKDADHITLIPGLSPMSARAHYRAGVTTRTELARLDWLTAKLVSEKIDVARLIRDARLADDPEAAAETLTVGMRGQTAAKVGRVLAAYDLVTVADVARLDERTAAYTDTKKAPTNLADLIDQARVIKADKVYLKREVDKLVVPRADIELDVDMENDSTGLIYMWGTRLNIRPGTGLLIPGDEYKPFVTWEIGPTAEADEARVFAEFWAWMHSLMNLAANTGLTFKAYYYSPAENRCMRHLAKTHEGRPGVPSLEEVEAFIASDHWVDLHTVATGQLLWPSGDMGLKSLAKIAGAVWSDESPSGDNSIIWYRDAVEHRDPAVRESQRERLLAYNADDVKATWVLREWLGQLASARVQSKKVHNVASIDRLFRPRRRRTR